MYTCELKGDLSADWRENATVTPPVCVEGCAALEVPIGGNWQFISGYSSGTVPTVGATANIVCDYGYTLDPPLAVAPPVCVDNGDGTRLWDRDGSNECVEACPQAPPQSNTLFGVWINDATSAVMNWSVAAPVGTQVILTCLPGYAVNGIDGDYTIQSTCLQDKTWSTANSVDVCEPRTCPLYAADASFESFTTVLVLGATASVVCATNFISLSEHASAMVECRVSSADNVTMENVVTNVEGLPTCVPQCPAVTMGSNWLNMSYSTGTYATEGAVLNISCKSSFVLDPMLDTYQCSMVSPGVVDWSPSGISNIDPCIAGCSPPVRASTTVVEYYQSGSSDPVTLEGSGTYVPIDTEVKLRCLSGFAVDSVAGAGNYTAVCTSLGVGLGAEWSDESAVPACAPTACAALEANTTASNTIAVQTGYVVGQTAEYVCAPDMFRVSGNSKRSCSIPADYNGAEWELLYPLEGELECMPQCDALVPTNAWSFISYSVAEVGDPRLPNIVATLSCGPEHQLSHDAPEKLTCIVPDPVNAPLIVAWSAVVDTATWLAGACQPTCLGAPSSLEAPGSQFVFTYSSDGLPSPVSERYTVGVVAELTCDLGYDVNGEMGTKIADTICVDGSPPTWIDELACVPRTCNPFSPPTGTLTDADQVIPYTLGMSVTVTCDDGYKPLMSGHNGISTAVCAVDTSSEELYWAYPEIGVFPCVAVCPTLTMQSTWDWVDYET